MRHQQHSAIHVKQNRVLIPICLKTCTLAPESEVHGVTTVAALGGSLGGTDEQGGFLRLPDTFTMRISLWDCVVLKKVSQLRTIPEF